MLKFLYFSQSFKTVVIIKNDNKSKFKKNHFQRCADTLNVSKQTLKKNILSNIFFILVNSNILKSYKYEPCLYTSLLQEISNLAFFVTTSTLDDIPINSLLAKLRLVLSKFCQPSLLKISPRLSLKNS